MNFAQIALVLYLLAGPLLFGVLPPRRAVIAGFLLGWLFLPVAGLEIKGLPDISKTFVVSLGVLLGVAIFNPGQLLKFRPRWYDIPVVVWCLVPIESCQFTLG